MSCHSSGVIDTVSVCGIFVWGGWAHYPGDFDVLVHPSRGMLIFVCVCGINGVVRHCTKAGHTNLETKKKKKDPSLSGFQHGGGLKADNTLSATRLSFKLQSKNLWLNKETFLLYNVINAKEGSYETP